MRSVSIALLQAVDQRLCALVHMTKKIIIAVTYDDLRENYSDLYNIVPGSMDCLDFFKAKYNNNRGMICCKGDVCVLAIQDANRQYSVYTCTSSSSQVKAFTQNCDDCKVNYVSVFSDGAISIMECPLEF
jgi:hypothetical protein